MSRRFVQNAKPQGLALKRDIITAIGNACAVDIAVSYLQMSGWFILRRHLEKIPGARVRILTTDQMNITQPAVLKAALRSGMQVKCYRGKRVYHPKVYVIHGVTKSKDVAILGSANISGSGLEDGVEAGIQITDRRFFMQLARWFDDLFRDPAAQEIDDSFVTAYEKRWKRASRARAHLRRTTKMPGGRDLSATPEDLDVLDDAFSTIALPVGTLGFDHAGNNIRNLSRLLDVLSRYPSIGNKERSELRLLGFRRDGNLSKLGMKVRQSKTSAAAARLWTSWVRKTPDARLNAINSHLASFKRAATRFWRLNPDVRKFFLREITNPNERPTLQAIELCCNGGDLVESFSVNDFRTLAQLMLTGEGLSEFIKDAITDYRNNKGSRSWTSLDRRVVLHAWR